MSDKKKAPARGARKSIVEEYKAKAKGRNTSKVLEDDSNSVQVEKLKKSKKKSPAKKKSPIRYEPILTMEAGGETYSNGEVVWYVLEGRQHSKRPHSGEIKECYPNDATEPCVLVIDHTMQNFRTIRSSLLGRNKAEAKGKWLTFVEAHPSSDKSIL
jgi:hypothetical protein